MFDLPAGPVRQMAHNCYKNTYKSLNPQKKRLRIKENFLSVGRCRVAAPIAVRDKQ